MHPISLAQVEFILLYRISLVVYKILHQLLVLGLVVGAEQLAIVISFQEHPEEHFRIFLS